MILSGAHWAQIFEAGALAVARRRELSPADAFAEGCRAMAAVALALDQAGTDEDRELRVYDVRARETRDRYPWIHQDERDDRRSP